MDGARSALRDATSKFRTGKTDDVSKGPQQWHITIDINCVLVAIYLQCVRHAQTPELIASIREHGKRNFLCGENTLDCSSLHLVKFAFPEICTWFDIAFGSTSPLLPWRRSITPPVTSTLMGHLKGKGCHLPAL